MGSPPQKIPVLIEIKTNDCVINSINKSQKSIQNIIQIKHYTILLKY